MGKKSLFHFLTEDISFQNQAWFEFRYPVLFKEDSFMIESLNFPKVEANVGNIYLDGYKIPVHSTGAFDNEISFSMYVDERDLRWDGKYFRIFNSLLNNDHKLIASTRNKYESIWLDDALVAKIIPLSGAIGGEDGYFDAAINDRTIILYNALIKSISIAGGFVSNSTTLAKFDVSMTYSFFEHYDKRFESSDDGN